MDTPPGSPNHPSFLSLDEAVDAGFPTLEAVLAAKATLNLAPRLASESASLISGGDQSSGTFRASERDPFVRQFLAMNRSQASEGRAAQSRPGKRHSASDGDDAAYSCSASSTS
jgi:hypothetical protein